MGGLRLLAIGLVCLPLLYTGCGDSEATQAPGAAGRQASRRGPAGSPGGPGGGMPNRPAVLVETVPVEIGPMASVYTSTGTLQAEREADVKARVRARVRSIAVEEGDRVDKGQVLCLLEERELRIARDRARATARNADLKFERAKDLSKQDLISEEEYQEASHNAEVARADAELAELNLSYATIRSPIPGRVSVRHVDEGQEVNVGDPVFHIVDEDPLHLELHVPERLVGDLAPGQPVDLILDASGRELRGTIARLSPVVDTSTGTVKVTVQAPSEEDVRTGSFARARVVTELHEEARIIPRDALVSEGDDFFVFTVKEGTARRVPVKLGFEEAERVEILEGPEGGEEVVVAGAAALREGSPVEVLGEEPAATPEGEQPKRERPGPHAAG